MLQYIMVTNKDKPNKALIIGTSKLYDLPDKEFYLVYPFCCGELFNLPKTNIYSNTKCPTCHKKIEINNLEIIKNISKREDLK